MTTNYAKEAADVIASAEFRDFWPRNVRKTLVRAAQTEGEFPPYAVRDTERALRAARNLERKMAKDIEIGEKSLTQAQRKALAR